jgi:hypothetical protein
MAASPNQVALARTEGRSDGEQGLVMVTRASFRMSPAEEHQDCKGTVSRLFRRSEQELRRTAARRYWQ